MNFDFKDGLRNVDISGEYLLHIVYEKKEEESLDAILTNARAAKVLHIFDNGEIKNTYPNVSLSRITVPAYGDRIRLTFINEGGE